MNYMTTPKKDNSVFAEGFGLNVAAAYGVEIALDTVKYRTQVIEMLCKLQQALAKTMGGSSTQKGLISEEYDTSIQSANENKQSIKDEGYGALGSALGQLGLLGIQALGHVAVKFCIKEDPQLTGARILQKSLDEGTTPGMGAALILEDNEDPVIASDEEIKNIEENAQKAAQKLKEEAQANTQKTELEANTNINKIEADKKMALKRIADQKAKANRISKAEQRITQWMDKENPDFSDLANPTEEDKAINNMAIEKILSEGEKTKLSQRKDLLKTHLSKLEGNHEEKRDRIKNLLNTVVQTLSNTAAGGGQAAGDLTKATETKLSQQNQALAELLKTVQSNVSNLMQTVSQDTEGVLSQIATGFSNMVA